MKRLNLLFVAALSILSLSAGAQSADLSGVFSTDFNDMVFSRSGRWTQENARDRLVFEFDDDFTAFTGKWRYNDDEPTSSKWNGTLK